MSEPLSEALYALDGLDALDAAETLSHAADLQRGVNLAQAEVLKVAAHWADLNSQLQLLGGTAFPGTERLVTIGGEGTPEIAEFAPAELGAQLQMSPFAASMLIADALDLRHRLPQLWHLLVHGEVKVHTARQVAQRTRKLSRSAAAIVDAKTARYATRLSWTRLSPVLEAAILTADPDRAKRETAQARDELGVFLGRDTDHGYRSAFMRGAAPDIEAFDIAVGGIADALDLLGDTDPLDVRRAKAIGIIASTQATLDLFARAAAREDEADHDGPVRKQTRKPFGSAVVYVHLSEQAVTGAIASAGIGRLEDVGPVLRDQIAEWLGHRNVIVKPVIDLNQMPAVDSYEIPTALDEAVDLRSPADCFPHTTNTRTHRKRSGDKDHTRPYVPPDNGGPPGQTALPNLGRLTRFHHRVKTHGNWKVIQLISGSFLWKSPHGFHYLVDHTGTTNLGKL